MIIFPVLNLMYLPGTVLNFPYVLFIECKLLIYAVSLFAIMLQYKHRLILKTKIMALEIFVFVFSLSNPC